MHPQVVHEAEGDRGARLDRRLHDVAWGLLLLLTGIIWLVPGDRVADGVWLFGVAGILLGVNAVRYVNRIGLNMLSLVLGFAALVAALTRTWTPDLPLLAICFIVIGTSLLARPLLARTTS